MKALVEAQLYRDAGAVKRYHVKRVHRTQTVAEHTFGVLMLLKQVLTGDGWGTVDLKRRAVVYEAVLHHDLSELVTGDIPAPIKRAHPKLGPLMEEIEAEMYPLYKSTDNLTVEELQLIKWADRVELVMWCLEEYRLGNTHVRAMVARGLGWILASPVPFCTVPFTHELVADARSVGIEPASGSELEEQA